jgi:hypothetical protein
MGSLSHKGGSLQDSDLSELEAQLQYALRPVDPRPVYYQHLRTRLQTPSDISVADPYKEGLKSMFLSGPSKK